MRVAARSTVDLHDLRIAGGLMLAGALLLPLVPGPDGMPCPLRALTGVPCPLCGMTTSVIALVHLHPVAALAANPAGVLAVVLALALVIFPRRREVSLPRWPLVVGLLSMELWQLARFHLL